MPSGTSSATSAEALLGGLQNISGAIMSQIVKNKGALEFDADDEGHQPAQSVLAALHDELLKTDPERKGLFKKGPCEEALRRWDADEQDHKFSKAAEVDSGKWATDAAAELRGWMKKQYMKRNSQRGRDEARAKGAAQPAHQPPTLARKRPAAAQGQNAGDADGGPAKRPAAAEPDKTDTEAEGLAKRPAAAEPPKADAKTVDKAATRQRIKIIKMISYKIKKNKNEQINT